MLAVTLSTVLLAALLSDTSAGRADYIDPIYPDVSPNGGNTWRTSNSLNGVTWGDVAAYGLYKTLQLWYWDDVTSQFYARAELDTYSYYVSDAYASIATPGKSHHDVCDATICVSGWTLSWL
jgi:hypothetical protein